MKRSSRLIILLGVVLAIAAFGGVILLSSNQGAPSQTPPPATTKVVVANADIPLGSAITAEQLGTKDVPLTAAPVNGFSDPSQVVGRVVRRDVRKGEVVTIPDFSSGLASQADDVVRALKPGYRAMSFIVDRVSGVGTLIQPGDHVDAVVAFMVQEYVSGKEPGDIPQKFPPDPGLTTKVLVQNLEVLGTMIVVDDAAAMAAAAQAQAQPAASGAPSTTTTSTLPVIDTQREIVILAVTAQQAEVLKYAQIQAVPSVAENPNVTITLILRAPADREAPDEKTTGITMNVLVEQYGVLPPGALPVEDVP